MDNISTGPDFEAYLKAKRIDATAFSAAEPNIWESWKREFDQMHPNSFTMQKLNLINAVRRKYPLAEPPPASKAPAAPAPRPGKPVIRPKIG